MTNNLFSLAVVVTFLTLSMTGCWSRKWHEDGWIQPENHGTAALSQDSGGKFSKCTSCHGSDLSGADAPSCKTCHHPAGWADGEIHGAAARSTEAGSGFFRCQVCHESDFNGDLFAPSCKKCHLLATGISSVHPASWFAEPSALGSSPDKRRHATVDRSFAAVCIQCHNKTADLPPDCFNASLCHLTADPHGPTNPTDHALDVRNYGDSATAPFCGNCHDMASAGTASLIGCKGCHLGAPTVGAGRYMIEHPENWNGSPRSNHKNFFGWFSKDASSCSPSRPGIAQYCHGAGLPGNPSLVIVPPNGTWPNDPEGIVTKGPVCTSCHGKEWDTP